MTSSKFQIIWQSTQICSPSFRFWAQSKCGDSSEIIYLFLQLFRKIHNHKTYKQKAIILAKTQDGHVLNAAKNPNGTVKWALFQMDITIVEQQINEK